MKRLVKRFTQYRQMIIQLFRFVSVGFTAFVVNFIGVFLFVHFLHLHPLIANVFAFMTAFFVSFFGHYFWTFSSINAHQFKAMRKFLLVSVGGFFLNELLFAFFLQVCGFYYLLALLIALLIVPPLTFICSKMWAFK